MDGLDGFLDAYGLAAACGVMLVKAVGVPIPVPGDVILLATASRAAQGKVLPSLAFASLLVAISLGGVLQYLLARGPARRAALRFGRRLGLTEDRLERVALRARRGGLLAISVAVLTPGVRSAVVPACGLAGIPLRTFVPGLVLGSAVDLALHFAVGYLGADVLTSLLAPMPLLLIAGPTPAPLLILAGLALVGLAVWLVLARRRRASAAEAFAGWAEATCPVCLALEAVVPHAAEDVALGTSVL